MQIAKLCGIEAGGELTLVQKEAMQGGVQSCTLKRDARRSSRYLWCPGQRHELRQDI